MGRHGSHIGVLKTMKWLPYWCPKPIPWAFNSFFFFLLTLSFVKSELINMTRAWDKEKNLSPRLAVYHRVVMHLWCLEST